ncbi:hypothetical protein N8766_04050 [bacterium]|jgi:hypothetical protein|nr:hypothetical protein [Verrucomicrobiota bacterium]MDA7633259.1 hypothetical protein [bacterium]MDA7644933.1 hypothetical protein [bacterium]MDA7680303.1 hypothetical protein [bacterium]
MNTKNTPLNNHSSKVLHRLGISLILSFLTISLIGSSPLTQRQLNKISDETSLVEKPAKAAEIISRTDSSHRQRMAIRVVRLFLKEAHSLAPSLVGAIASSSPDVIVEVTAEAVQLFPENAYSIVKAAVAGAPELATAIALRLSVENISNAEAILAGAVSAKPEAAPIILAALESPETLQRTETQSSLIFRGKHRHYKPKPKPVRPSIELNRNSDGVWIIHIDVPKGRHGNQIAQQLRRILRNLLSHPRLRSKFKIVIHRYTH